MAKYTKKDRETAFTKYIEFGSIEKVAKQKKMPCKRTLLAWSKKDNWQKKKAEHQAKVRQKVEDIRDDEIREKAMEIFEGEKKLLDETSNIDVEHIKLIQAVRKVFEPYIQNKITCPDCAAEVDVKCPDCGKRVTIPTLKIKTAKELVDILFKSIEIERAIMGKPLPSRKEAEQEKIWDSLLEGRINALEAAFRFDIAGIPIPRSVEIAAGKTDIDIGDVDDFHWDEERMDRESKKVLERVRKQKDEWTAVRQEEIYEIREDFKKKDSFTRH